jgi:protein-S-isoprenylcysteine O-methyltransferase
VTQPYQQPGANVAFWTILGLFILGENAMRYRTRRNRRGGRRAERSTLVLVVVCVVGAVAAGIQLANWSGGSVGSAAWPLFVLGLVLMCVGIAIRQWAVATLARFFTIDVRVQPGQTVVEGGPYRWVRHPSYTGLIVTFVGFGLALGNWASLAVLAVVPTAGLVYRIRFEERVLLEGLGGRTAATRRAGRACSRECGEPRHSSRGAAIAFWFRLIQAAFDREHVFV